MYIHENILEREIVPWDFHYTLVFRTFVDVGMEVGRCGGWEDAYFKGRSMDGE